MSTDIAGQSAKAGWVGYIAIGPAHLVHLVETTSSNNITIYNMFMERDFILDKTGLYCCWSSAHTSLILLKQPQMAGSVIVHIIGISIVMITQFLMVNFQKNCSP